MYHSIAEAPPRATRRLSVTPEVFAAQLQRLACLGYATLTLTELGARLDSGADLPERAVALTFDDGYADFYDNALPMLQRHDFTATVFVTTGWLDDAGASAGRPLDRMLSCGQIREIVAAGMEIGAHSHSHAQLDRLSPGELAKELLDSKELLERVTGVPVHSFAYPYGYSNNGVRAAVGATGYRYAVVVANACVQTPADPLALPRLTIRRSTSITTFERIVRAQGVGRAFLVDRALTRGFALVRRGRNLTGAVRGG
jgi:peptidoglycan/xylan/chitin deacetylase (PgdA/CDA1 family)